MEITNRRPLVPSTVVELLDRTFRIYRDNFLGFIGLVAAVTIPLTLLNTLSTSSYLDALSRSSVFGRSSSVSGSQLVFILVALITGIVQGVILNGTLTYMASESYLGRRVTVGQAFSAAATRFVSLGVGLLLFYLIIFLMAMVVGVLSLCLIGFLGFGAIIYFGLAIYAMLVPVLVLENVSASFGINRAWYLGKTRFWFVAGLMLVIWLISLVITLALGGVQQFFAQQLINSRSLGAAQIVVLFFQIVVGLFTAPIFPIAQTLLYYDSRIRLEGLDIAFQSLEKPDPRPSDVPSPAPSGGFLSGRDVVNLVILSVGTIVLTLLFSAAVSQLISQFVPGLPLR
jgi:hypothetical protein